MKTGKHVGVFTHYLRYSSANLLVLVAGMVSFPLLTRLLDNTQYGILGYYETWVAMAVAVAKLGAQHAIIRLYPHNGDPQRMQRFATNLLLLPMAVSTLLWLVGATVLACVHWYGGAHFTPVMWCAVLSIPLTVFISLVQMIIRAAELSGLLMITRVAWRWLELALMVGAVIVIERSALSAYGGKLLAALLVAGFYLRWIRQNLSFARKAVDLGEFGDALRYGMPLVLNEIAGVTLMSIDRVMLKSILDDFAAVGIYSVGYGLALQVSVFMSATLSESFVPVANRLYETGSAEQVRQLKRRILLPLTYVAIGIGVAIWSAGDDVVHAISGPDKHASGQVFAWVGTLYALYPLLDIAGYGLLLHKRTVALLNLNIAAAIVNIALNWMLIPSHGYMGAVYATVVAYGLLGIATCLICPRDLLRLPDRRSLLLACLAAAGYLWIYARSDLFGVQGAWPRLFTAFGLWLVLYVAPVLALESRLRGMLLDWWRQRSAARAGAA